MCHANNEKQEKQITHGIELLNQERIRTLGEKKNYKYLGILEANTIKQAEMKEKNNKKVSQTNEKTSRNQALLQETHQNVKHLGFPLVR